MSQVGVLSRGLTVLGLAVGMAGGILTGWSLFRGGGDEAAEPASFAYVEKSPCQGCPVSLRSAEVQARQGSTLFAFGGAWPSAAASIPADVRLEANDVEVTLHPTAAGFEIAEGSVGPGEVAAGLVDGRLLINLADPVLSAPVEFSFQVAEARLPAEGTLVWDGSGRPEVVAREPVEEPVEEPTAQPETPEEFADALAAAFRGGDANFLFDRLNPAVIDVYGPKACRAYVRGLPKDPTREFRIRRVSEPEPYDYEPDGLSIPIAEAYAVTADVTIEGATERSEIHFAPVGETLTWFTDCGDPLAS